MRALERLSLPEEVWGRALCPTSSDAGLDAVAGAEQGGHVLDQGLAHLGVAGAGLDQHHQLLAGVLVDGEGGDVAAAQAFDLRPRRSIPGPAARRCGRSAGSGPWRGRWARSGPRPGSPGRRCPASRRADSTAAAGLRLAEVAAHQAGAAGEQAADPALGQRLAVLVADLAARGPAKIGPQRTNARRAARAGARATAPSFSMPVDVDVVEDQALASSGDMVSARVASAMP